MADRGSPAFRDADWSVSDELIVATEHMAFVRNLLGQQIKREIHNQQLGLTRLWIPGTTSAARALAEATKRTEGAARIRLALRARDEVTGSAAAAAPQQRDVMGMIAGDLRALAIAQHGGWMPTLGRNRLLSFPGSVTLGATREISFGAQAGGVGAAREISFGSPGNGGVGAAREISFGGGSIPTARGDWAPSRPRVAGPGQGVRVGVLDTGIWPHPWLAGGWTARPSDVLPERDDHSHVAGHGTFVAGLILSQAPGATVVARRVLDDFGHGTAWEVAEAIVELGQGGVDVLNLSFCCYTSDAQPPLALARAVDRVNSDVVIVAAAGNHAINDSGSEAVSAEAAAFQQLVSWPAALDDVLAVGALDEEGEPATFSPERPWVDVAVRGTGLTSTYLTRTAPAINPMSYGSGWALWGGTSFAAALVSGAVAAGIDPGRVSAPDAAASLLSAARPGPATAGTGLVGPPRLGLRLGDRG